MTDKRQEPMEQQELDETQIPPLTELDDDPRIPHIVEALRHVYDPEIPANIYELGLIYEIRAREDGSIHIDMTLTTPHCPVAEEIPQWVKEAALKAPEVENVTVELTWDPPWNPSLMAESARWQLNMF